MTSTELSRRDERAEAERAVTDPRGRRPAGRTPPVRARAGGRAADRLPKRWAATSASPNATWTPTWPLPASRRPSPHRCQDGACVPLERGQHGRACIPRSRDDRQQRWRRAGQAQGAAYIRHRAQAPVRPVAGPLLGRQGPAPDRAAPVPDQGGRGQVPRPGRGGPHARAVPRPSARGDPVRRVGRPVDGQRGAAADHPRPVRLPAAPLHQADVRGRHPRGDRRRDGRGLARRPAQPAEAQPLHDRQGLPAARTHPRRGGQAALHPPHHLAYRGGRQGARGRDALRVARADQRPGRRGRASVPRTAPWSWWPATAGCAGASWSGCAVIAST
jgi:hypothetical protein